MKKLIAISVVFALVAGAAFAQVNLGASLWTSVELISGNTEKGTAADAPLYAGPGFDNFGDKGTYAKLAFSYETDGAEAGIAGKIEQDFKNSDADKKGTLEVAGAGWWKPMDMLTLWVGDQGFGRGDRIGWGDNIYYSSGTLSGRDFKKAVLFEGGSGNWFGLSLAPMDMFTLNVSLIDNSKKLIGDTYGDYFMIQAVVAIPNDMGELAFTYDNSYTSLGPDDGGAIFVDYSGSPIAGLSIDFAFSYFLGKNTTVIGKDEAPFFLALKAGYDVMDGLNVAAIFQSASFNYIMFGADVSYGTEVSGFNFGLGAGIKVHMGLGDYKFADPKTVIQWEFKPSLSKAIGGFTFLTYFKIAGSNVKNSGIDLELPIKFSYAF